MIDINRKLNLVQTTTKNIVNGINFDLEISQDHSKYTSYLLGISSAGIGVCLFNLRNTLGPNGFLNTTTIYYMLLVSLIIFMVSIFVGIWARRNVIKALIFKRIQMSIYLHQEDILYSMKEIKDELETIHIKLIGCLYLSKNKQKRMEKLEKDGASLTHEAKLIFIHEILIGFGFLLILLSILPKPPL